MPCTKENPEDVYDSVLCYIHVYQVTRQFLVKYIKISISRAGIPNHWDLMPDDLRWSWCNSNRNKVHNKWNETILPSHPGPWKNCLPQNRSLTPKRLEADALGNGMYTSKETILSNEQRRFRWNQGLWLWALVSPFKTSMTLRNLPMHSKPWFCHLKWGSL